VHSKGVVEFSRVVCPFQGHYCTESTVLVQCEERQAEHGMHENGCIAFVHVSRSHRVTNHKRCFAIELVLRWFASSVVCGCAYVGTVCSGNN
jgi:hypothetical protein